jgi:AcrR family transcriptional regulator
VGGSGRGRGRPVGADSAETRARILHAAREVISELGYEAANFQVIAQRAGISRPAMHYYFSTKEQLYECLQQQAYSIVADCIAQAQRQETLLSQLSTFFATAHRSDFGDGTIMSFIIISRLELHRNPSLRGGTAPATEAVREFYQWMVDDAIRRGELAADTDAEAVANMLFAMFWGIGFFSGFVSTPQDMMEIAKQLRRVFRHGLLPAPVLVSADVTGDRDRAELGRTLDIESGAV